MIRIIRTLNLNRETTAILENAYGIGYEKQSNSIWQASFSLPLNDPKVSKVELLKYVEIEDDDEYIGLFRIIPKFTRKNSEANYVTFQCEHVLSTFLDSSLFQYHQLSNYTTTYVLQFLIDQQKHKHWKLGTVAFTRYFHYSWENENLLSALFSVPKPFNEQYRWTWDTKSYPWTLNLVKPEMEPTCRIKEGYNLRTLEIEENPMSLFNRIYPLGAGEGINQLTIKSVNNGVPFLEDRAPGEEIKEVVWADLRFTDAESLKASAQALLDKWKKPIISWDVSAADVSKITGLSIDALKEGKVIRLDIEGFPVTDLRIMKESRPDIKGDPGNVQLEIGNVQEDLSTTQADLERRQQVNETYSQGATNIDSRDFQDNCDPNFPAIIRFWIPDDVVNVNQMSLTYETHKYRAYERSIKGGGSYVKGSVVQSKSTSAGGGTTATSSSGGGQTTSSGGGQTSSAAINWMDGATAIFTATQIEDATDGTHYHLIPGIPNLKNHTHSVSNHTHTVSNHTHSITLQPHSHNFEIEIPAINIPEHVHEIEYGIFEYDKLPTRITITVDGNVLPITATSGDRIDLIPYLKKDSSGKIARGRYAEIKLTPNDLARINANVTSRLFVQSRIGGTF